MNLGEQENRGYAMSSVLIVGQNNLSIMKNIEHEDI